MNRDEQSNRHSDTTDGREARSGTTADRESHPGGHPGTRDYSEAPLIVTWEATRACGLTCDHCRADARHERDPGELTTGEGERLIDQVLAFDRTPILVFSGGDPLERPDLFDLIEYATDRGLPTAVTPAPTTNLTRDVVERFADLGVHRMALSLDGPDPATHDGFRGETGSFETVRRAAGWADDAGLPIQINTTVTGRTAEYLPAVADEVRALGAAMWEVFFLVPVGRGATLRQLSPERADRLLAWLYRHARTAPYRVITVEAPQYRRVAREVAGRDVRVGSTRAGSGFVFVSHRGEVYPSGFLPLSGGSVPEEHLVTVYREAPLFESLRDPDSFAPPCGECRHRDVCGGSRSRACAAFGDPLAADPLCPRVAGARE